MKILYLSGSYVPSRRASSVQVMRMCAAFAGLGHEVVLVTKRCAAREEAGVDDPYAFYGVSEGFSIEKLPRPALRGGGLLYLLAIDRRLARRGWDADLVYARDLWGAAAAARRGLPVIWEAHGPPAGGTGVAAFRRLSAAPGLRRVVFISDALRRRFEECSLLPAKLPWLVAHDGADPLPPAESAEKVPPTLLEPLGGQLQVGYVGHLYPGRGVGTIVRLAHAHIDCRFHLIGGSATDIARWTSSGKLPENLELHGFLPPARLAACYRRLDVLLMPYQTRVLTAARRTDTSAWMSPMKMFEYMAAGRAIISSDLPVLREVLEDGRNALLVPAEDPAAWSEALTRLEDDPDLRRQLGEAAARDLLETYSWRQRARRVLEGV